MAELGLTQGELSRRVGTTTAMISLLLNEQHENPIKQSRLWPRIVEVLGGTPPTVHDPGNLVDKHRQALLDSWDLLSDEDRAIVEQLIRSLTAKAR